MLDPHNICDADVQQRTWIHLHLVLTSSVSRENIWSRFRVFTPGPNKSSGAELTNWWVTLLEVWTEGHVTETADHVWWLSSTFLSFTVETLVRSFYFDWQLKRAGSDGDRQPFTLTLVVLIPKPESEMPKILDSILSNPQVWFCIIYWLEVSGISSVQGGLLETIFTLMFLRTIVRWFTWVLPYLIHFVTSYSADSDESVFVVTVCVRTLHQSRSRTF